MFDGGAFWTAVILGALFIGGILSDYLQDVNR